MQPGRAAHVRRIGAGHSFGHRHAEFLEMLLPVLRQVPFLVPPVHGLGLKEVLAFVAAVVEEDFIDQLRTVERSVVGQEGIVVGLADERAGAGKDRVDGEAAVLETVDIGEVAAAIFSCERSAADAVALRGVDDPHRVVHALHQRHVVVHARALAHGAAHARGVAEEEQVARPQVDEAAVVQEAAVHHVLRHHGP